MGGVSQTLSSPPFVCHWAAKSAHQLCPWICIHQKVISKARTALKGSLCPRLKVIYAHFCAVKNPQENRMKYVGVGGRINYYVVQLTGFLAYGKVIMGKELLSVFSCGSRSDCGENFSIIIAKIVIS